MDIQTGSTTTGNALKRLLWLLVMLGGVAHAGTVTYVYTDPQGTPLAEADASGNITATFDYAPYGSQALGAPPSGPGYTGHVNDPETGLVYMQARYYDPAVGRFLSVDPAGMGPGNVFSFNRYDYVNNNPIVNVDPDGGTCKSTGVGGPTPAQLMTMLGNSVLKN
ncbi:RHS repeat-associated core domain-containing protein [Rhodanobacter sp. B05]|uniref:RHS repeat-associated core domain-containing protein n=1 Tax=Rhodanobacter sp. B05 TaxID=1945859 RepID=UPI00143CB605|nr:RHS repeat-associated core domain-containing protein [Rhodanobacter sp. B05]